MKTFWLLEKTGGEAGTHHVASAPALKLEEGQPVIDLWSNRAGSTRSSEVESEGKLRAITNIRDCSRDLRLQHMKFLHSNSSLNMNSNPKWNSSLDFKVEIGTHLNASLRTFSVLDLSLLLLCPHGSYLSVHALAIVCFCQCLRCSMRKDNIPSWLDTTMTMLNTRLGKALYFLSCAHGNGGTLYFPHCAMYH